MEAEFKRLVMRSPFDVRVEKPKREGEATLLYPFEARAVWVAACHHRTSSRITWDLCSSDAVRLEPLSRICAGPLPRTTGFRENCASRASGLVPIRKVRWTCGFLEALSSFGNVLLLTGSNPEISGG